MHDAGAARLLHWPRSARSRPAARCRRDMACHCLRRSVLAAGWVERALAVLLTSPNSPGSGDCHTDGGQQLLLAAASRAGSGWPPAADGRAGLCCLCSQPPTPHSRPAGQPLCTRTARHAAPGSPQMSGSSSAFAWPFFYSYPPYFTRQPVKETADKQASLWGSLILAYCKHFKVYVLSPSEDIPLWHNADIQRRLAPDAAVAFLDDLVAAGHALWLDPHSKGRCLVLWRRLPEVAAAIASWAAGAGVSDSVMLLDELAAGPEVAGTELEGLHREVLLRALALLEQQGKVKLFRGATPEEEGVKFL